MFLFGSYTLVLLPSHKFTQSNKICVILLYSTCSTIVGANFFSYVGLPKEDIFPGHLLSPIFQSSYTVTITNFHLTTEGCPNWSLFVYMKVYFMLRTGCKIP